MKTLAISLVVGLCAAPAYAQLTIERIAPENSVMVMGMPNAQLSRERFERTPLFELWKSDAMKELREQDFTGATDALQEFLDELGVDRNELSLPTGAMGMAMFSVIDEELGAPAPAMIAFADFGAKSAAMGALVVAMLDRGERDRMLEFEIKDILGRKVYEIRMLEDDADMFDDDDDFDFDFDPFGMMPNPMDMFSDMSQMYFVQDENVFMLGSDLGSITEALDRIDGNARGTLADRDDFQAIMGQIGRDDFYMVVLTRDLMQIVSAFDEMGMLMFVMPTIRELFGDIRGFGMGARIDGTDAMLEGRWSVYMPAGKRGLTRLMDLSAPRAEMPSFVGLDSVSYSSLNFRFDQVVSVLRSVINSNPLLAMQSGDIMPILEGPVADILATLGSRVHTSTTISRPITAQSLGGVFAIEAKDPQQFENLFGQFAPEMGMEPRDFLGQRIFTMDMGGMMGGDMDSLAIGIGGGFVFMGPTPSVEQSLRTVSRPDQALTLEQEGAFRAASALLSQRQIVGYSYTNIIEMMSAMTEVSKLQFQQFMEEMRRDHPEWADEMDWGQHDTDVDWSTLRRYIGPMISEMRSTDEGFVGTLFMIAPAN